MRDLAGPLPLMVLQTIPPWKRSIYGAKKPRWNIQTCEPHPFRAMVMDIPPSSSWPPFFAFSTAWDSRIAPAPVPQTGLTLTNSFNGSESPARRASSAMVVLSARRDLRSAMHENLCLDIITSSRNDQGIALRQILRVLHEQDLQLPAHRQLFQRCAMLNEGSL